MLCLDDAREKQGCLVSEICRSKKTCKQRENYLCLNLNTVLFEMLNSVTLVRKRTISTERPPLVGEVSAKSCG
jgi:hypothetical protein